jgi:hypothetical protein
MGYNSLSNFRYGACGSGSREYVEATKEGGDLPILRIERRVDYQRTVDKEDWRDYLETYQAKHPQFTVRNLGALTCTYFDNTEIAKMLGARYPKVYGKDNDYKQTKAIQRGFSRAFNQFRDSSLSAQRQIEEAGWQLLTGNEDTLTDTHNSSHDMWTSVAAVAAPNLTVAGGRHLAIDLSRNGVLHDEYAAIRDYLRTDEKLDLNLLTHGGEFKPHVSILRSTRGLIDEKLTAVALPRCITLEKPTTSLLIQPDEYFVPELDVTIL